MRLATSRRIVLGGITLLGLRGVGLRADPGGPPFLERIESGAELELVSAPSERQGEVERTTKFLLPAPGAGEGALPPLFQNTSLYAFHREFLAANFPDRFPGLTFEDYRALVERRATRRYYAGTLSRYRTPRETFHGFSIFTDTSNAAELLTLDEVASIHAMLRRVFLLEPLVYAPITEQDRLAAAAWQDAPFGLYLGSNTPSRYEGYSLATGYGRVKVLEPEAFEAINETGLISSQDLLVLRRAPSDIEGVVGGVITAEPQGELSHLSIRTARRNTPNAYLADALAAFGPLEGKLVRLDVRATEYTVTEATPEEAQTWWAEHRPKLSSAPVLDLEHARLDSVEELDLSGASGPPEARHGGKATNFARLQRTLTGAFGVYREPGLSVPIRYYFEFLRTNTTVSLLHPPRRVSFEEYLRELLLDPTIQSDPVARNAALAGFRDVVEEEGVVAPELLEQVIQRIGEVFGSVETPVRFRSSSNVEDGLELNGAGLYESTSACAADSADGDDDGPSLCFPSQPRERTVERALKKVWASLWTFRAFEERAYYQIPQDQVGMAVFISRAYLDEEANGVAFTGNPANLLDTRFVVTAQKGEESVVSPAPGVRAEKSLLEVDLGEVTGIERAQSSSLLPPGERVLDDATLRELGRVLAHLQANFPVDLQGHDQSEVLLDIEIKVVPGGRLAFKQARPFLARGTGINGPTFELVVPDGAVLCGAFVDARSPRAELAVKSELRLTAGTHSLPTNRPYFAEPLVAEVRFGARETSLVPASPGRFRVTSAADGKGSVSYDFRFEQQFHLLDGRPFVLRLSFLTFETAPGVPPQLTRTLDEGLLLERVSVVGVPDGDLSRIVRYSTCAYASVPLWNCRFELEGGGVVHLEERFQERKAGSGPAALARAIVELGGEPRVVEDYWRLVYAAEHHNVNPRYLVLLEPPADVPGVGPVASIELAAPEEDTGAPARATFLDAADRVLARPAVLCYRKAPVGEVLGECGFRRGDFDASGRVSLTDAIALLLHLFQGGNAPACPDSADFDDDNVVDLTDAVLILSFLFRGVDLSAPPGPYTCGPDPTPDQLGDGCRVPSCEGG